MGLVSYTQAAENSVLDGHNVATQFPSPRFSASSLLVCVNHPTALVGTEVYADQVV
jgi:hypothetical protein